MDCYKDKFRYFIF